MAAKQLRRLKAVTTMLKLENHELQAERVQLAQHLQELSMHESAVASASEAVRRVESRARGLVEAEGLLSIESLAGLLQYMPGVTKQLEDAETTLANSETTVADSTAVVAERHARVRGFERVQGRIALQHAEDVERASTRESDDLWLQRRGADRD